MHLLSPQVFTEHSLCKDQQWTIRPHLTSVELPFWAQWKRHSEHIHRYGASQLVMSTTGEKNELNLKHVLLLSSQLAFFINVCVTFTRLFFFPLHSWVLGHCFCSYTFLTSLSSLYLEGVFCFPSSCIHIKEQCYRCQSLWIFFSEVKQSEFR